MFSILKQVIKTKNDWGLKPLIIGSLYELLFLIRHPRFKYLFVIEPQYLDISSEESKLSDPYVPAPYFVLSKSLKCLKKFIRSINDALFIDIGCGTGRALYYASTMGFEHIIGIEQSRRLVDVCNRNLSKYLSPHVHSAVINRNVRDIAFLQLISEFCKDIQPISVVFFLYAPFNDEMLQIFANKFDELTSFDCFIVYFGPQTEGIITEKKFSVVFTDHVNKDTPIKIYFRERVTERTDT